MRTLKPARVLGGASLVLLLAGVCAQALAADRFSTTLKPIRAGQAEVSAIAVTARLEAGEGQPLVLQAPIIYPGAWRVADRIQGMSVVDAQGPVPLEAKDDAPQPGGFPYYRRWTPTRAVTYPVTIQYTAAVQPVGDRNGPPFGIRPAAGGVSGLGAGFMVMPQSSQPADLSLSWDLSDLAPGSVAATSYAIGDAKLKGPISTIAQSWYLAGPAGRYPATGEGHGFTGFWLGTSPFDPAKELAYSAKLYAYLAKAFGYLGPEPEYRVFMRFLDTPPVGGGTAQPKSFMLSRASAPFDPKAEGPRETLAHEMIHQWTGGVAAPDGVSSWFSEGLTTFYTALLPMRGGFTTVDAYTTEINRIASGYQGSAAANWTAAKIAEHGFGSEDIRHVPYLRSALYFADIDARVRAKTKGKRKLDDVLAPMFVSRENGVRFDHAAWKAMVVKELGPQAAVEFEDRILEGKPWTPVADAYGPCFTRVAKTYQVEGKAVAGYAWQRVASVPDKTCQRW